MVYEYDGTFLAFYQPFLTDIMTESSRLRPLRHRRKGSLFRRKDCRYRSWKSRPYHTGLTGTVWHEGLSLLVLRLYG